MATGKIFNLSQSCPQRSACSRMQQQGSHRPGPQRTAVQRKLTRGTVTCSAIGSVVSTEWNDEDYIEVGTLGRAHGIKGEVLVGLSTSSPDERFGCPGRRFIQAPPAQGAFVTRAPEPPREVQLVGGRKHVTKGNQVWLLRFDECPDRDTAETLRNYRVLIHKNDREALDEDDEFYSADLVGLTVALAASHPAVSAALSCSDDDDEAASGSEDCAPDAEGVSGAAAPAPTAAAVAAPGGGCGCCPPEPAAPEASAVAADAAHAGGHVHAHEPAASADSSGDEGEEGAGWDDEDDDEDVVVALGEVVDVYDGTGTHGVLRIKFREGLQLMPDGQLEELSEEERQAAEARGESTLTKANGLLPFARELVPEVDLEDQLLVIDPPAGWLELYLTPKEKKKRKFRKRRSPKPLPVPVAADV